MCISRNYVPSGQSSLPFLANQADENDGSSLYDRDLTVPSCLLDLHLQATQQRSRCLPFAARSEDNVLRASMNKKYLNKVQHDYHDYGDMIDDGYIIEPVVRGGVASPFPTKLHEMLDDIERDGYGHVVSWQPHGRCFIVRKPKEFVEHVMPTYFKQSKLASFQRQLNLYGFQRLTRKGPDKGAYYHEKFLRGKVFLSQHIHRIRVKGTCVRARSNPDGEPDFEQMPPIVVTDVVPLTNQEIEYNFTYGKLSTSCPTLPITTGGIPCVSPPSSEWYTEEANSLVTESEYGNFEGMKFHLLDMDCISQLLNENQYMNKTITVNHRVNLPMVEDSDDAENMESVFQQLNIPKDFYFDMQGAGIDDEEKFGNLMQRILE
jgi:HSF-type DNA-binding